jgi:endonuclease/exonuclease/phosphatase family metal-dependent hydrolase
MVYRLELFFRKARHYFSRNEWLLRLLRVEKSSEKSDKKGLIIIQIDGLSHNQLSLALKAGNMPFLKNLTHNEHYRLHSLYSGMPSSTASVQGELFYGVKTCVPAFSFKQHSNNDVIMMIEPMAAEKVEQQISQEGEPLLTDGSAYANIFTGGAKESHFCSSAMGWGSLFRRMNPIATILFFLLNSISLLRTLTLIIIEFFLSLVDFFRGIIRGHDLFKEMTFVPTRVAICVLLREWVTIGVKLDATRGLPVIHANFLGYDEQAHRRGPSSAFAHWGLKGIDAAIKKIWLTSKRSAYRDYDIWIYSDHGQEQSLAYSQVFNETIQIAVNDIFSKIENNYATKIATQNKSDVLPTEQSQRAQLLGSQKTQKWLRRESTSMLDNINAESSHKLLTIAMGPLGFIYSPYPLSSMLEQKIAKLLVHQANIPMVMAINNLDDIYKQVRVWTNEGEFYLPADRKRVLGKQHPFLDAVTADLIALIRHRDAGDFVISGWIPDKQPYSFCIENGAHGGPGFEETKAFALLPDDTLLPIPNKEYLRPLDLRKAALNILGRQLLTKNIKRKLAKPVIKTLRVMTYNVHSCIGMDGKLSPQRIARVIAQYHPDIVALQELDVTRLRTESVDQAHLIAQILEMDHHFHAAIHVEDERYGDAILSHLPITLIKTDHFPLPKNAKPHLEPRGVLWAQVKFHDTIINVMNTHLGLTPSERTIQVDTLLGREWLAHPDYNEPMILCGDFNAAPWQSTYRRLNRVLNDVQVKKVAANKLQNKQKNINTFSGRYPTVRIDHIFIDESIKVKKVKVAMSSLARVASDHLPLIVDLEIDGA